jgi:hypothetical protein
LSSRPFFLAVLGVALKKAQTMKPRMTNPCLALTALLWSAIYFLQPLMGLAQNINEVLSLDGTSAYVSIPSGPDLQNPTEITIEAWVYPDPAGGNVQTFVSKGDGVSVSSDRTYEIIWVANGGNTGPGSRIEVNFFVGTSSWALLGTSATAGQWLHVAATYRSSDGLHMLFINGILAASRTTDADKITSLAGAPLRQTSQPLYLGRLGHPTTFNYARGYVDEVRIWNKARTQDEIRSTMSCRSSGDEPNLMGYWNFDDGTAADLTGNGHNGSLFGDAAVVPLEGDDVIHADCGKPVLNIRVSQVELCWDTMTTNWYQLQYRSSLTANQWVPFMTWLPGDGSRFCTNDVVLADEPQRYYRVGVTNAPPQ